MPETTVPALLPHEVLRDPEGLRVTTALNSLQDPEINPSDSYTNAVVSISVATSMTFPAAQFDPFTSNLSAVSAAPAQSEVAFFEAGWSASGQSIVNVTTIEAPSPDQTDDDIVRMRAVDNTLMLYDRLGRLVPAPVVQGSSADSPLTGMGPLRDLVEAGLPSTNPPGGGGGGGGGEIFYARQPGDTGAGRRFTRVSATRIDELDEQPSSNPVIVSRRHERRWQKLDSLWVPVEQKYSERQRVRATLSNMVSDIRLSRVRARRNRDKDDERARRRQAIGTLGSGLVASASPLPAYATMTPGEWACVPTQALDFGLCDPNILRGGSGSKCVQDTTGVYLASQPGAFDIALQHGIQSDPCTWTSIRDDLMARVPSGHLVAVKTANLANYDIQSAQQRDTLIAFQQATRKYLVVGHSQGGLISRRVAQLNPALVQGVITVSTPHTGALIANPFRAAGSIAAVGATATVATGLSTGLFLLPVLNGISTLAATTLSFCGSFTSGAPCDARADSPFLNTLNQHPENAFRRVGIVSSSRKTWILYRLIGDMQDPPTGGRQWATWMDRSARNLKRCAVIASVFGQFGVAGACLSVFGYVSFADVAWRLGYSNNEGGDGFIQLSSQFFPNPARPEDNVVVPDADSHVGAHTDPLKGGKVIRDALREMGRLQ